MNKRRTILECLLLAVVLWPVRPSLAETPAPADTAAGEQFEREVRPILVEHCQSCHGAKKQEMSLRLDTAQGLLAGSDNGLVVVPGEPDRSLLIEVVRYGGETQMPPRGKLSDAEIASLERWVTAGAAWPAGDSSTADKPDPREAARHHWAFQPISHPALPIVGARGPAKSSIDPFILEKLEAANLTLSPQANRRTLIRRATFDLHGLPPTPEEVSAFENDQSPEAFSHVVDRLLSSPRYGERWGRHWLDVARYSDTKGYVRLNENPRYSSSWTYRDYVIEALNADLPFDQFILEQLAADQLPAESLNEGEHSRALAALGYLTLGQRFLNSHPDIIDDRIDVVTRGLLGLTVSCARCHDHKFDPIPTRDYYGLYGVFANSVEPREPPLILPKSKHAQYAAYLTELETRTNQWEEYLKSQQAALTASMRARMGEYLLAGQHDPVQPNFLAVMFLIDASRDLNPVMVQRWARTLEQSRKRHDPVLAPWNELAEWTLQQERSTRSESVEQPRREIPPDAFAAHASESIAHWQSPNADSPRINRLVLEALSHSRPLSLAEAASVYEKLLHEAGQRWEQAWKENPSATQLDDPEWEELRQLWMGDRSPLTLTIDNVEEFLFVDATTQNTLHAQQRLVTDWIGSPDAAPHAMALEDVVLPVDARVFIRGNASNPGDIAPRQFLSALVPGERKPFQRGSGRLELAQAIASADNPLTARVIANRVWMHHFGVGIVRTPSDFGLRGERPTHPELLDHLASGFIQSGWSLKTLHRKIMSSATYQQQSFGMETDPQVVSSAREVDPENLLLGSMHRRRLDWESMRDALLSVSGQLDRAMGGPSVELFASPYSARRSVYGLIDRQSLSSELRTFDFAPPDASSPQRHQTIVSQQALFLMNSPFMKQQVQHLAAQLDAPAELTRTEKIGAAYRLLFGREATAGESELGVRYLSMADVAIAETAADGTPLYLSPWEEYLQALLLSNEFLFVD